MQREILNRLKTNWNGSELELLFMEKNGSKDLLLLLKIRPCIILIKKNGGTEY